MKTSLWLLPALLCCTVASLAPAAEPTWKVGLAVEKITPEYPVRMAGYGSRNKPSEGVAHDLYAKAMAIEDPDGRLGVMVTTDLLGLYGAYAEQLAERVKEQTGLKRHQLLLNASHTHTGPSLVVDSGNVLDNPKQDWPEEDYQANLKYSRELLDKLQKLIARAIEDLAPARLSTGTGVLHFAMNRREFTEARGVRLGVNPRGLVDRSVPVLRIETPEGKLRGVLFGAACHNTTLTGRHYQISGDFAGYAQTTIQQEHPEAVALFMQGCGGDANPYPRGSEEIARLHGTALGNEVLRVLKQKLRPVQPGKLRTAFRRVALPLKDPPPREQIEALASEGRGIAQYVAQRMKAVLDAGEKIPTTYETPIAVWQLGDDLTLVALPGEVVVEYVKLVEQALTPHRLWISAYNNDLFGYLPSKRVLAEGGYETRGLYAGGVGYFDPSVQDVIIKTVKDLAAEAGRPTLGE